MPAMSVRPHKGTASSSLRHPRPATAVTAVRGCHGQMPTGHKSSSRAARADGRDAQNTKIWRKVHSISVGLDSRKYSAALSGRDSALHDL